MFGAAQPTGSSNGNSAGTSNSGFSANSFITLLTAQLQAQDPTNPVNPQEMMSELVSLNTLQTLTNIQQILQVSTGVNPGQASATGSGTGTGTKGSAANGNTVPSAQAVSARTVSGPSSTNHDAIFQNKFNAASGSANQ
jgi:flagellar basal-body rod modification protein FlgD